LVQGLYDIAPLEPLVDQGYTLLTANYRLARRIKAEWDAQRLAAGEQTWEPLQVYPVDAWLQAQWELAASRDLVPTVIPLSSAQTLELWRQIIREQERQTGDYHLLRPSAAADLASQARDLLVRWRVEVSAKDVKQLFTLDADCRTFLHWLERFEVRLAKAGQCTEVDCLAQLPGLAGQLPPARVALIEIDTLAPLPRAALAALCTQIEEVTPARVAADRLVHAFSDKRAELQALAAWAVAQHRTAPDATIGIVLSDMQADRASLEYLLRREFDCLGQHYTSLPVNFSTGITLAQAPLVRDALAVLAMGLQQTTLLAVEGLLRSRFLDLPDSQSALAQRFVTQLYAQGRAVVSTADLRSTANHVHLAGTTGLTLGQYLNAMSCMRELHCLALPSTWQEHFSDLLAIWGWPGRQALDSLEYQQLALWQRTLEEFRAFDHVCDPIPFSDALSLLRDCCHRQVSQPQTADSPVQVLGPLEAAGLSFEHLWLCGMQGSDWPASPRPNPFIPVSLQNSSLMPHANAEREWAFADALLTRYASTSKVLHASYCRQVNGVPDLPSALLQNFAEQPLPEPPVVPASWLKDHSERTLQELIDDRAARLACGSPIAIKGGSQVLEDQSQCPFRAFARHRLETEPLAALHLGLSPGQRGALLHEALHALWGELRDSNALTGLTAAGEETIVAFAARAAIATIPAPQQRRTGAAYWRLEQQRLVAVLHEWLIVERQRGAFSVAEREQDIAFELAGLQLQLRADRVDELPDGTRMIVDYKTGNCAVQDWLGERPALPQLPLYSLASSQTVSSLAFAKVSPRNCRFIGLGKVAAAPGINTDIARAVKSRMAVQDWPELTEHWHSTLTRLAQEFIAGDAQIDPLTPASCAACGMQSLCRVGASSDDPAFATGDCDDSEIVPLQVTQV
jgi:ATP-dependent helicase/nuclease subunit B